MIGTLSPPTLTYAQVQQGSVLTVTGSHFVGASEVLINGNPLSTTVVSDKQLTVELTSSVISGPGAVDVKVHTPGGGSGDLACSSGGNSSALVLTVN